MLYSPVWYMFNLVCANNNKNRTSKLIHISQQTNKNKILKY